MNDDQRTVTVFTTGDEVTAGLAKSVLEQSGIEFFVTGSENIGPFDATIMPTGEESIAIQVFEKDVEEAGRIIADAVNNPDANQNS